MLNLLGVVDALTLTEISFHTTQTRLNKHLQAHELKENIKVGVVEGRQNFFEA